MRFMKIITALTAVFGVVFLSSCVNFTSFENLTSSAVSGSTEYEYITSRPLFPETSAVVSENTTTVIILPEITTAAEISTTEEVRTTLPQIVETQPQITETQPQIETTQPPTNESIDYSSYSKQQIIDVYADALNKTRAYAGALTAEHTESFVADVKDAYPGGALTELLANNIVKLVGSEGQQTLNFSGGKATNKDGESVPVLLPQRTSFSLPADGVANASIEKFGDMVHIKLTLIPETVSMGQIPKYNSSAIGYLDTSDMDFKIITISRVDIGYTGSVIDAYIRSDGYVDSVNYTINMSTYAELSGMGITGYGTLEGAQTEKWQLKW